MLQKDVRMVIFCFAWLAFVLSAMILFATMLITGLNIILYAVIVDFVIIFALPVFLSSEIVYGRY